MRVEDLAVAPMTLGTGVLVATSGTIVAGMVRFAVVAAVGLGIVMLLRLVRPAVGAAVLAVLGGAAVVGGGVIVLTHLLTAGLSVRGIGAAVFRSRRAARDRLRRSTVRSGGTRMARLQRRSGERRSPSPVGPERCPTIVTHLVAA